jgi:hypothetical protein
MGPGDNLSVAWRLTVVIDPQTIGKMADASGEIAKTTNTALELTGRLRTKAVTKAVTDGT